MGNAGRKTVERAMFDTAIFHRDRGEITNRLGLLLRVGQASLLDVAEAVIVLADLDSVRLDSDETTSRYAARLLARITAGTPKMTLDDVHHLLEVLQDLPDRQSVAALREYTRQARWAGRPPAPLYYEWERPPRRS